MDTRPIGLLDSGVGGLSIWRSVTSLLPYESTIYIGDQAYNPYHAKSRNVIQQRVCKLISYLLTYNAKMIVVACNTATVMGIDKFRKAFQHIPIIGIVPVVKTAAEISKNHKIGILSTSYTARSAYIRHLIRSFAADCVVINTGSSILSSIIEQGITHDSSIQRALNKSLRQMLKDGVDVIALGCSHFPFVADQIQEIVGKHVTILDCGGAVARHIQRILKQNNCLNGYSSVLHHFYTTGDETKVTRVATQLLHRPVPFHHVTI